MAAALLGRYLARSGYQSTIKIFSAGLIENPQEKSDERAKLAAEELGVSLASHRPMRLTPGLIEAADVIFLMDRINEARIVAAYPKVKGKIFFLGSVSADQRSAIEIRDPGAGDLRAVRRCYLKLDTHVRRLASLLISSQLGRNVQTVGSIAEAR
jgi:protein-tyrosine-phosphatase